MPLTGVAIYANGNIIIKEAQNLSTNSQDIEKDIIDKALIEAEKAGITLVSSNDDDSDDSNTITSDSTTNYTATSTTSSTSDSVYTDIDEENNIIPTEVIINGHTYDVTARIPNATTQEILPTASISCNYGSDNYRLDLKESSMSIYINGKKCNRDILISDIHDGFYYHDPISDKPIDIEDHMAKNDRYMTDFVLKIGGHTVGILDTNINTKYNGSTKYMYTNGQFIFCQQNYANTLNNDCTNFEDITGAIIAEESSAINNTDDPTSGTNSTNEVTIQSYVEKYYRENVGKTSIRGSIYSKNGNINISGNGKNFDVVGALITANGNLTINNVSHVNLHYDPDYVPFFQEQGILTTTIFESIF